MIVTTNDDGDVDEQDWTSKKNAERKKKSKTTSNSFDSFLS